MTDADRWVKQPPCKWVRGCVDATRCSGAPKCLGLDPIERPAKWLITSGLVRSQHDAQQHYVSAGQVARLHRLCTGEWVRADDPRDAHLSPRQDGVYADLRGQLPPAPAPAPSASPAAPS